MPVSTSRMSGMRSGMGAMLPGRPAARRTVGAHPGRQAVHDRLGAVRIGIDDERGGRPEPRIATGGLGGERFMARPVVAIEHPARRDRGIDSQPGDPHTGRRQRGPSGWLVDDRSCSY